MSRSVIYQFFALVSFFQLFPISALASGERFIVVSAERAGLSYQGLIRVALSTEKEAARGAWGPGAIVSATLEVPVLPSSTSDLVAQSLLDELQNVLSEHSSDRVGRISFQGPSGQRRSLEQLLTMPPAVISQAVEAYHAGRSRLSHGRVFSGPPSGGGHHRPKPLSEVRGALAGKRIALSPGHGNNWYDDEDTWRFQRGIVCNLREDIHTEQIVVDELTPMLLRAGADVISTRERTYTEYEQLLSDPTSSQGNWATSASGFNGSQLEASADLSASQVAYWEFEPQLAGVYALYVYFVPAPENAALVTYTITGPGGEYEAYVDQSQALYDPDSIVDLGIRYPLGEYFFTANQSHTVSLSTEGLELGEVVVADALRLGGGVGTADFGLGTSGLPRWQESARAFLTSQGAPDWVVGSNDVVTRPLYALLAGVDAYFSLHTNAYNGSASGTETYVWHHEFCPGCGLEPIAAELPPGTIALGENIQQQVVQVIRHGWDSAWPDRATHGCNFGELRPISNAWAQDNSVVIPAALIELAFHDNCSHDTYYIREQRFRRETARAIMKGMIDSLGPVGSVYPPLAPHTVQALPNGPLIELSWEAGIDPIHPQNSQPEYYLIHTSLDGIVFDTEPILATATTHSFTATPCTPHYFKVTALNQGGQSMDSIVVGAVSAPAGEARVLVVDGMDRWAKSVLDPNYGSSFVAEYIRAITADTELAERLLIASASDESVGRGLDLGVYDALIWINGETSTRDQALTPAERDALADYLDSGGTLLMNGSELAWYLGVTSDDSTDSEFLQHYLMASYTAEEDDANVNGVQDEGSGPFAGVGYFTFGGGEGRHYLVEYPDILPPLGDAQAVLQYEGQAGPAAIALSVDRDQGQMGLLYIGFPLETIDDQQIFERVIKESLGFLIPDLHQRSPLSCSAETDDGPPLVDGGERDDGDASPGDSSLPPGDTALEGDGDPASGSSGRGCGCHSTSPAMGLWWTLLLLVVLYRRRLRSVGEQ